MARFEIVQDNGCREVMDGELIDGAVAVVGGEVQEQFRRVTIGGHCVRTHVPLGGEVAQEESVISVGNVGTLITVAADQARDRP